MLTPAQAAETFTGVLCAAHLHSWLTQQEEQPKAEARNGQPVER